MKPLTKLNRYFAGADFSVKLESGNLITFKPGNSHGPVWIAFKAGSVSLLNIPMVSEGSLTASRLIWSDLESNAIKTDAEFVEYLMKLKISAAILPPEKPTQKTIRYASKSSIHEVLVDQKKRTTIYK